MSLRIAQEFHVERCGAWTPLYRQEELSPGFTDTARAALEREHRSAVWLLRGVGSAGLWVGLWLLSGLFGLIGSPLRRMLSGL